MTYGYSQGLVSANKKAGAKSLGVALGRECIRTGVSVYRVAAHFGVSRMTVYNWFKGEYEPQPELHTRISAFIRSTQRPKTKS